ncbi:hypothetical protein VNO77_00123 [Canavalia gladiata]|uniref:Uncharacterized protein n=1 Tax=Canavalia gladiata TaxID=3824 RepID=A0AAN9MTJ9_CANGL
MVRKSCMCGLLTFGGFTINGLYCMFQSLSSDKTARNMLATIQNKVYISPTSPRSISSSLFHLLRSPAPLSPKP